MFLILNINVILKNNFSNKLNNKKEDLTKKNANSKNFFKK
jgi:hypothetical protein